MNLTIRNETKQDYRIVEEITRQAFWNLYVPGCNEHFLAHVLREHPDFLPSLDFVAEYENTVVGNVMYAKSSVVDATDETHKLDTITFGPFSVLPEFQKRGIGSVLLRYSIEKAKEEGHSAIIIHGHPHNYCKHGFRGAIDLGIGDPEGNYPYSLLALELQEGAFAGRRWKYFPSTAYDIDEAEADEFDKSFEPKTKEFRSTQVEFSLSCRAFLR